MYQLLRPTTVTVIKKYGLQKNEPIEQKTEVRGRSMYVGEVNI